MLFGECPNIDDRYWSTRTGNDSNFRQQFHANSKCLQQNFQIYLVGGAQSGQEKDLSQCPISKDGFDMI